MFATMKATSLLYVKYNARSCTLNVINKDSVSYQYDVMVNVLCLFI